MIIIFVEFNFRNSVNGSLNSINMILKKNKNIVTFVLASVWSKQNTNIKIKTGFN